MEVCRAFEARLRLAPPSSQSCCQLLSRSQSRLRSRRLSYISSRPLPSLHYVRPISTSMSRDQQTAAATSEEPAPAEPSNQQPSQNPISTPRRFRPDSRKDTDMDKYKATVNQPTPDDWKIKESGRAFNQPSSDYTNKLLKSIESQGQNTSEASRRAAMAKSPSNRPYTNRGKTKVNTHVMDVPANPDASYPMTVQDTDFENAARPVADLSPSPVKLGPSLGKSFEVIPSKGMDLSRAFRSVEMRCSANRVRAMFYDQRFHERPGLKKKRLKSQRWRSRFKQGFQAVVRRVEELRRKGW